MSKQLLKIYYRLPFAIQKLVFNYKAKQDFKNRYTGNFQEYYQMFMKLWYAEPGEIKNFQESRIREVLSEAYHHSPWFKKRFHEIGISIGEINEYPFSVVSKMPFLTKDDIRSSLNEIISKNEALGNGGVNYTSGTTGSPMKTYNSTDSVVMTFAMWKRFHSVIGLPMQHRSIRFSGNQVISLAKKSPPFWMYNKFEQRYFFSLYHLTQANLPFYIEKLNEFKPELLDGYPSGVYAIANYLLNNKIRLDFVPAAICTTAEPLTPLIKETIESAFRCKVYNQYSASEGGVFITECTEGKLHVNTDTGYVEFLNERDEPGKPGEICQIILTGFRNLKTPLIRYRTGDWVKLADEGLKCSCGTHMPVISEIYGRVEDYLVDENGIEQGMVSYRAFKMASNIIKAQLIQQPDNAVTVRIVKDLKYSSNDEAFILSRLHAILGKSIPFHFEYCDEIETGPNGKFKTVIRKKEALN